MQGDEAFFLIAIRRPETTAFSLESPFGTVSLTINSYVGTIKAALMAVAFRLWGPSVVAMRTFGIAALALSGVLFFTFARRFAPPSLAALFATALLFDPTYAATSVLDWGPVALQHIFLLLTLLAAARAIEQRSWQWAFAAGIAAGLGVWDKALFGFSLIGVFTSLLILSLLTGRWREWSVLPSAIAGGLLGGAPFLASVLHRPHGAAVSDLARLDWSALPLKAVQMLRTMDGTVLQGFLVNDAGVSHSIAAGSRTLLPIACALAAVLVLPVLANRFGKLALAAGIGSVAAWLSLALVRDAGIGGHHTILIWPGPYLFLLFAVLAWRERRPALATAVLAAVAVVAAQNARVLVNLRSAAMARGWAVNWSDAQYPLSARLLEFSGPGRAVLAGDWGLLEPAYLITGGRLDPRMITDVGWKDSFDAEDRSEIAARMQGFEMVTVAYRTRADALYPHIRPAVEEIARACGFQTADVTTVTDRLGVPRFEIVRYRRP